jgi:hypothetical protein
MDPMNTGEILLRLEKLEKQNRMLKRAGLTLLLFTGAIFWMGQTRVTVSKTVESRNFSLRDAKGKKKAELGITLGRPALQFYDDEDRVAVSVGVDEDGRGMVVYGPTEQRQASFILAESGPVLSLFGPNGMKRMNLSVTPQGGPAIGLLGPKGEAKSALGVTAKDEAFLQLFGRNEQGGVQLFAAPDRAVLRFFDISEKPRAVLGMLESEGAGLTLNDSRGTARAILMQTAKGWGLDFLDENKGVIWHAP